MNLSQEKGKRWLTSNMGIKPNKLQFDDDRVPAFTTEEGEGYHVKRLIGKNAKTAVFYPAELRELMDNADKNNILFVSEDGTVTMMPARAFPENQDGYQGMKFVIKEGQQNGHQGEIMMHLSRRNAESRHYRVNHVQMESLLVFKDGDYHMSTSVAANGKPDFWLVLHPAMIS